jgi:hypothetical protein
MGKAYLVVRAVVADATARADFDKWYSAEHLPDAVKAFAASRGWRCWSCTDPGVHYAFYEFSNPEAAQRATGSDAIRALVAEFDRAFPTVNRTREIIEVADEIGPPT